VSRTLEQLDAVVEKLGEKLTRKYDDVLEMYREVVGYARQLGTEKQIADHRWDTVVSRLERIEGKINGLTTNGTGGGDHHG
jgi:hypothetical protein